MQDGISLILVTGFHRAAEEDVEAQRQELMAGFDDAQRKREHEFRKKLDDLSNSLLASELKVRGHSVCAIWLKCIGYLWYAVSLSSDMVFFGIIKYIFLCNRSTCSPILK